MPSLSQIVVSWSGSGVVGAGASVFWCQPGDEGGVIAAARTFFNSCAALLPNTTQLSFPTSGNVIDELSGKVSGGWTAGAVSPLSFTGSSTWANGVGMRVKWNTIGVVNGRKVVGATFLVPLLLTSYEGAGNLFSGTITTVQGAAAAFVSATPTIRIYSRKTPLHAGISFPVLSATVPDKVSWLRSRRT